MNIRFVITTAMSPEDVADSLAHELTDLEFELLVRARIKREFHRAEEKLPNIYDNHHRCSYTHSFTEQGEWSIGIGENYSKSVRCEGEVLARTMHDAIVTMGLRYDNKLSKLLPSPTTAMVDETE